MASCRSTPTVYVPAEKTKAPAVAKLRGQNPVALKNNTCGAAFDAAVENGLRLKEVNISHDAAVDFFIKTGQ